MEKTETRTYKLFAKRRFEKQPCIWRLLSVRRIGRLSPCSSSTKDGYKFAMPWIRYGRRFSEFYLSIWNQLVFNQRLQLFVHAPQLYLLIFGWINQIYFPNLLVKNNKWISEFHRTNHKQLKCSSSFFVNYFLGYCLMMQHQPIMKRVNGAHEWECTPYQLLSAPYLCCLYKHKR